MIDYFSSIFGAYPFDAYGALVLDAAARLLAGDAEPDDLYAPA